MIKAQAQRLGAAAGLALVTWAGAAFLTTAPAAADGPCGQDYTTNTACPITTPGGPFTGNIVADDDTDYYVFEAVANTHLSVSILDTEDASCSTSDAAECGYVSVELYDSAGDDEGGPDGSEPDSGVDVPSNWSTILSTGDTYYLEVSGEPGLDLNGNPTALPYQLSVHATPKVVWPAPSSNPTSNPTPTTNPTSSPSPSPISSPTLACTIPTSQGATLAVVKKRLIAANCDIGAVHHVFDRHVRAGRVVKLSGAPGEQFGGQAKVGITVSEGKRPSPQS